MKKLTVEEKAQRYNEILARAKGANLPYYKDDIMSKVKEFVDYLLPELKENKESEGEKIRKAAIEFVRQNKSFHYSLGISKEQVLAWLEKQGEQKYADWSDDDEKIANNLISQIGNLCTRKLIKEETKDKYVNWLKSIIDRVGCEANCTTIKEWSDEDRIHYNKCLQYLESISPRKEDIEWFKSLKHQTQWKPSEEQMEALDDFIYAKYPNIEKHGKAVKSLYQDLKKLKG